MSRCFVRPSTITHQRRIGSAGAFTLTDMLVVIGMTALLSAALLSASFTTRGRVLEAQCANNLRQIGVGLSLYAAEANGYFPVCGWSQNMNPWLTYEACRVSVDSTNVTRGFYSLGLLFRTKVVPDARAFYCPSLARTAATFSYDYCATPPNSWPSTPVGSMDDNVRTGYNYYPQLRATEQVGTSYGVFTLPRLVYSLVQLEFSSLRLPTPAKWTELDPMKSVTTDLVHTTATLSHRASGSVVGANILFTDAHVKFVTVNGNSKRGSYAPFDPYLWSDLSGGGGPGGDSSAFRIIMNAWKP
jgi:hypothetical protein